MPTPCLIYKLLSDRTTELSAKFVDDQIAAEIANPATFIADLDRLAAFRLLIHAEIEDFLEEKAKENLNKISTAISSNAAWMRKTPELLPAAILLKKSFQGLGGLDIAEFTSFTGEILTAAGKAITENNGVKISSFTLLSVLAGKTIDEVDPALSSNLNSYGKNRGDVAHKSVKHSRTLSNPSTELNAAKSLVNELGLYFDVCP